MRDETWSRNEVDSPCVKVCVVHPVERICVGCFRTLDEIAGWSRMTDDQRREVIAKLPERPALLGKRRGGRAARVRDL